MTAELTRCAAQSRCGSSYAFHGRAGLYEYAACYVAHGLGRI